MLKKILHIVERINHSENVKKCKLKTGQLFYSSKEALECKSNLQIKYADFYNKIIKQNNKIPLDFNELFD